MSTTDDWAKAYARQAGADLDTREFLEDNSLVPVCHRLMFLQMACEKLSKAHLCADGVDPKKLQGSHAYTAKVLPIVLRQQIVFSRIYRNGASWIQKQFKHLAHEIEVLAPAVDRAGQRPDNCEYPWEDRSGQLHLPLEWDFAATNLLTARAGRTFLKLEREAIKRLE